MSSILKEEKATDKAISFNVDIQDIRYKSKENSHAKQRLEAEEKQAAAGPQLTLE
jgi:hypothetical protein